MRKIALSMPISLSLYSLLFFIKCTSPEARDNKDRVSAKEQATLKDYMYEGHLGNTRVSFHIYWEPKSDLAFYGEYSYTENPKKQFALTGMRTLLNCSGSGNRKILLGDLGDYQPGHLSTYIELCPEDVSFENLSGTFTDSSQKIKPLQLSLVKINAVDSSKVYPANKTKYTQTLRYRGKVGKLPIEALLHTGIYTGGSQSNMIGSYFYPTYDPSKIYTLAGIFGSASCQVAFAGNPEVPDGNVLFFNEHEAIRQTASLMLCKKSRFSINQADTLIGQMTNTDGSVHAVELNLIKEK